MLPTFVIGLREGLEAALIVGIIAAFLRQQGQLRLLRFVFLGVAVAVGLCLAIGLVLNAVSQHLPQRQQEMLETVIGALAVVLVTYMVVWMRRHSRELKGQLEHRATQALTGGGAAMVVMAFLAVFREGIETAVFLLAAFDASQNRQASVVGVVLGIAVAVLLGYGIYRGGVRLNLSKFFRATGLVLVLVAAGLVVNSLHTAHEAGWVDFGQSRTVDMSWLVEPGSVRSSLLTGMLGLQPFPVLIEVVGWLVYLIPVGLYVAWPPGKGLRPQTTSRIALTAAAAALFAAILLVAVAPGAPEDNPQTSATPYGAQVVSTTGSTLALRVGALGAVSLTHSGTEVLDHVATDVYTGTSSTTATDRPHHLSLEQVTRLNGGRLPLGLAAGSAGDARPVPASYRSIATVTAWVEPRSGRVLDLKVDEAVIATVTSSRVGDLALSKPVATGSTSFSDEVVSLAARSAQADLHTLDQRSSRIGAAWLALAVAVGLGVAAVVVRRSPAAVRPATTPRVPSGTSVS